MSKHTPGPWHGMDAQGVYNGDHAWIADNEDAHSSESAPIWADGKVIALVVHASDTFTPESDPSVDANARLIVAAPDLLEFAEEVRRTGDTRLASMAIALINKATGVKA